MSNLITIMGKKTMTNNITMDIMTMMEIGLSMIQITTRITTKVTKYRNNFRMELCRLSKTIRVMVSTITIMIMVRKITLMIKITKIMTINRMLNQINM